MSKKCGRTTSTFEGEIEVDDDGREYQPILDTTELLSTLDEWDEVISQNREMEKLILYHQMLSELKEFKVKIKKMRYYIEEIEEQIYLNEQEDKIDYDDEEFMT